MQESINATVLFVSHKYPPATGGMERQSFELITGVKRHLSTYEIVYTGKESILRFFLALNKRILSVLNAHPSIDTIHFNDGLIASLALYHKGYEHLKRIVTVHGLDVVFPLPYFQYKIIPRFNSYDQIIAVSQATADAIIARGVISEKVTVIPNGVDHYLATVNPQINAEDILAKHGVPIEKKYLVLLGRAVERKGFSWFIRNVLPHLDSDFHLLMIGPYQSTSRKQERWLRLLPLKTRRLLMLFLGFPSDEPEIRRLLSDGHFRGRVNHLGKLSLEELKAILVHSTAFLMPNITVPGDMEGFGLVCLEASICGTPVLASDTEGITDAIKDGKNGFLLESGNAAVWMNKLSDMMVHPMDYGAFGERFSAYTMEQYSWEKMVIAYVELFQRGAKHANNHLSQTQTLSRPNVVA